jgi:hypothetical protein
VPPRKRHGARPLNAIVRLHFVNRGFRIRLSGREALSYQDAEVQCEFVCYTDPNTGGYSVVTDDQGKSTEGAPVHLTTSQLEVIERRIKEYLATDRIFGIPIRSRPVSVVRGQSAI